MVQTLNPSPDYDLGLRPSLSHDTRFKSSLLVYSSSRRAPRVAFLNFPSFKVFVDIVEYLVQPLTVRVYGVSSGFDQQPGSSQLVDTLGDGFSVFLDLVLDPAPHLVYGEVV